MDKSIIRKILTALLTILILVYVIYLISNASFQNIRTETAVYSTMTESLELDGYFIKDETIIEADTDKGVISYVIDDGDKIAKGDKVAELYKSAEDAQSQSELAELEAQLKVLTELQKNGDAISVTPDVIDENIAAYLIDMSICKNSGDLSKSDESIEQILYNINERQLLIGKVDNFNDKISKLEADINKIKKSSGSKLSEVKSTKAGYFSGELDGYENNLKVSDINSIMLDDLEKAKSAEKRENKKAIGKVISNVFWYIACPVTSEQAIKLNEYKNNQMTVTMPSVSVKDTNITLVCINRKDNKSGGVAIFRGTDMNSSIASIRSGSFAINMNSYVGIAVPESAVHQDTITVTTTDEKGNEKEEAKKVSGVYVQYGNELEFKEIVPMYSDNGFVICKQSPTDDELFSGSTIKIYDQVVVEGVDLYDGKVIS